MLQVSEPSYLDVWEEGYAAYAEGAHVSLNPYMHHEEWMQQAWKNGWKYRHGQALLGKEAKEEDLKIQKRERKREKERNLRDLGKLGQRVSMEYQPKPGGLIDQALRKLFRLD